MSQLREGINESSMGYVLSVAFQVKMLKKRSNALGRGELLDRKGCHDELSVVNYSVA